MSSRARDSPECSRCRFGDAVSSGVPGMVVGVPSRVVDLEAALDQVLEGNSMSSAGPADRSRRSVGAGVAEVRLILTFPARLGRLVPVAGWLGPGSGAPVAGWLGPGSGAAAGRGAIIGSGAGGAAGGPGGPGGSGAAGVGPGITLR